jgi:hypothetical protein
MLGAFGHFHVPPPLVPLLWAGCCKNDGSLTPWQSFAVLDPLTVAAGAAVELLSGYAGAVASAGSSGRPALEDSASFIGTVVGMTRQEMLDLAEITAGANIRALCPVTRSRCGTASTAPALRFLLKESRLLHHLARYTTWSFVASKSLVYGHHFAEFFQSGDKHYESTL